MDLKFDPQNPKYEYITTQPQAVEALEKLGKHKAVAVDIEATSLNPFNTLLVTVQIGLPDISYVFDARTIDLKNLKPFKELLENPKIIKILQNGKFDYKHIKKVLGIEIINMYDTMLAEHVLTSGIGRRFYSLKYLALKYAEVEIKKDTRDQFTRMTRRSRLSKELLKYGAVDTLILFPILHNIISC